MNPRLIDIPLSDGSSNKITVFQNGESKDVIILFPAMGVAASYYEPFAKALAEKGIIAITADLRGLGNSSIRPSSKSNFGFHEILELDYKGMITKAKELFPGSRVFIMGHSLGGILGSLYISKYPNDVSGLILTASCNIYYDGWSGLNKWKTRIATQVFAKVAGVLGYFPGHRLGFGGKGAARVIQDWAYTARTANYKVLSDDFDFEAALAVTKKPLIAISFDKDDLAPRKAVDRLAGKFKAGTLTRHHLDKINGNGKFYSHFNWVKNADELSGLIKTWLTQL